ncbi:DUF4333 domain-containing protein [Amycolatopsis sp. NPDC004368]
MRAVTVLGLCGLGLLLTTSCSPRADPAASVTTVTVTPTPTTSAGGTPNSADGPGSSGATPASATGPGRVFDAKAMDTGVAKILTDTYKIADVGDVSCPDRQGVTDGSTFQCVVDIAGVPKHVPITVTGTDGDYTVDPPR